MSEAVDFLTKMAAPGTHMNIVAFHPRTSARAAQAFDPDAPELAEAFIQQHSDKNLYWSTNPLKAPLNKKAEKSDVAKMARAHVDIDQGVDTALARLRQAPLPPTTIIFSGGGYQGFWDLQEPICVNGNVTELEAANKVLIDFFGGDKGTYNIDRIMRLPGTTNWPTPTKLKKDPNRTPVLAKLIEYHPERVYALPEFQLFIQAPRQNAPATQPRKTVKGDRSVDLWHRVTDAIRRGDDDSAIHTELDSHPHAVDQPDPRHAVQKCIDKIRAQATKEEADIAAAVEEMNRRHAVINWKGRIYIMTEIVDPYFQRAAFSLSSVTDLSTWYANKFVGGRTSQHFGYGIAIGGNTMASYLHRSARCPAITTCGKASASRRSRATARCGSTWCGT